ncbi:hypothetical protein SCOCK_390077 [Actinacidiphila cocklensis]|uniref:Uncharacterized protein n=1 Tax=Actinacidiphila cocklensis TaxID=887465 RepID=A0A9W4E952_9ACTN|nr:hypothetical protein SCOCK_390077 [Actinacidiphila cocklensis]
MDGVAFLFDALARAGQKSRRGRFPWYVPAPPAAPGQALRGTAVAPRTLAEAASEEVGRSSACPRHRSSRRANPCRRCRPASR